MKKLVVLGALALAGFMATGAMADVNFWVMVGGERYDGTPEDPIPLPEDEQTKIELWMGTNEEPIGIGVLAFDFLIPADLALKDFGWLSGLDGPGYIHQDELPSPNTGFFSGDPVVTDLQGIPVATLAATYTGGGGLVELDMGGGPGPFGLAVRDDQNRTQEIKSGQFMNFIPEPATAALMAVGGLLGLRRRRD